MNKAFAEKFRVDELRIFETDYWIWSLRPHQATLGAGVISLKRPCASFSGVTPEEHRDLHQVIVRVESGLMAAFQYDAINYLMLMMVDKHVHYHVLPRYQGPREMFGRLWEDASWPAIPFLGGEPLNSQSLSEIRDTIITELR